MLIDKEKIWHEIMPPLFIKNIRIPFGEGLARLRRVFDIVRVSQLYVIFRCLCTAATAATTYTAHSSSVHRD